jgi:hypothetical protein
MQIRKFRQRRKQVFHQSRMLQCRRLCQTH